MSSVQLVSALVVLGGFVTTLGLLWLQFNTFRHTHHRSLALLLIATALGLAYLTMSTIRSLVVTSGAGRAMLFYCSAAALLLQYVFTLWGSASLFQAFRGLHDTQGAGLAPNNRWRGP
jgi:hypothetical protein